MAEMPETELAVPEQGIDEHLITGRSGFRMLGVWLLVLLPGVGIVVAALVMIANAVSDVAIGVTLGLGVLLCLVGLFGLLGLRAVAPGEARVIQLFGHYQGTIRQQGFRWVNPFTSSASISTRVRNHETELAKVNDLSGSPIEIAAVVVWQVVDTARASFAVDDFVEFVEIQSEAAVRHIATSYPYDGDSEVLSLRQNAEEITSRLSEEIAARVAAAGVEIIESRITQLAYAPEIARSMLRRQQAGAVIAAREQIVSGAVGMVKRAMDDLSAQGVIDLDDERRAAMVSNLMVVLCGDSEAQPVVNAGGLYQ